ncbi:MAG: carbamoyltransferase HypF [Methanocellales archaeon]|nr:carbamoyltransferase HypF [Methanocellales archaeon]
MKKRAEISVFGIAQGVGFRPFVYRAATDLGLKGYVRNMGTRVDILVEGEEKSIQKLIDAVSIATPLARVDDVRVKWMDSHNEFDRFQIFPSAAKGTDGFIPPDVATCDACLGDIYANTRYRNYWATSCVDCGPRFTVLEMLPYDRNETSMVDFPMCPDCEKEYTAPLDRRYHAQAIACRTCGPSLTLHDSRLNELGDPIKTAADLLKNEKIVAIKGIGGFHLAALLSQSDRLRTLLGRKSQPFAVMATLDMAKKLAHVSDEEGKLLISRQRPIVLLRKREPFPYESVAPGLHTIGIMLPYTGLHHLLFEHMDEPLIMTSANRPDEPMTKDNEDAYSRLKGIAEYYLVHNRRIVNRCDDSVVRVVMHPSFIRMSRGYAPTSIPVDVKSDLNVLALGPELTSTVTIYRNGHCYISQHVGNVTNPGALAYLEDTARKLVKLTQTKIDIIAHDLHPIFLSTVLAKDMAAEFEVPTFAVQHHQAHVASLMDPGDIIGIAADGVGYGSDGTVWGGEIFADFQRVGGLLPVDMPGGDLATYYPSRMVAGILHSLYKEEELKNVLRECWLPHGEREIQVVLRQLERGTNVIQTSSTGRVLDAAAALLGICYERTYEGEPAMKLESAAIDGNALAIAMPVKIVKAQDGRSVLDTKHILDRVVIAKRERKKIRDIAAAVQRAIAIGFAQMAMEAASNTGIDTIGISGGVAYNSAIVKTIKDEVTSEGYKFVTNEKVPCGDGGISFGQAILTARNYDND